MGITCVNEIIEAHGGDFIEGRILVPIPPPICVSMRSRARRVSGLIGRVENGLGRPLGASF